MSNTEMQATARSYINAINCPICMDMMEGNIYQCKLGHSICGTCKSSLEQTCPQCRNGLTENRNYQLEELIKEVKTMLEIYDSMGQIACSYSEYGCIEQMDLKCIQEHEKECKNRKIFCSFANEGCPEFLSRENIESHERTCQFRTVPCVHGCEGGIPIAEITDHHSSCENGKYPCRFSKDGCTKTMRICELVDHEMECKHRSIHCIFSKIGCGEIGKPKEIEKHESNCLFRTTSCSFLKNGCEAIVSLSQRADHESMCQFNLKKCIFTKNGCTEAGKEEDIQKHESSCKFATFPCIFNQKGCSIVLKLPEMEKHELVCEFRLTSCIFSISGCTESLKVSELEDHERKCGFLSRRISLPNFCDTSLRCNKCKIILNSRVSFNSSSETLCCAPCSNLSGCRSYRIASFENLIEEIGKRFLLPCRYKCNGCDQSLDLKDKHAHEIECEFRDVLCKISPCTWEGKIELLSTHTSNDHDLYEMTCIDNKYYSYNIPEYVHRTDLNIVMLKTDEELFSCSIQKQNNEMYWAVQLIGQTSVASKYKYKIKISMKSQELIAREVCESDTQKFTNLISSKRCVCFPYRIIENFMNYSKFNLTIEIEKQLP